MRSGRTSFLGVALFALVFSCNSGPRVAGVALDETGVPLKLATPRERFSFIPLADGRVLASGGFDGQRTLSSCEVFEPESGLWHLTGTMHSPRRDHAAVRMLDGRVLVMGGTQGGRPGVLASVEVFEPSTGTWTLLASMSVARDDPAAVLLPDGRVLVAGGTDADGRPLRSAEVFQPLAGTWEPVSPPGFVRGGAGSAVMLPNGKALFVSGLQAELYDVATGRWEKAGFAGGAAGTHRQGHSVTMLPDGRVLVVGGGTARASSTAEVYDAMTGLWTLVAPPAVPREHHAAVVTREGAVLVLGGEHSTAGVLASVERFDPATGLWSFAPALVERREPPGALVLPDGAVLLVGGGNEVSGLLATSEKYLPGGCVPRTCMAHEAVCGATSDGCGGTLECGPCVLEGCDAQQCRAEGLTRR
ncbi:Kelch repeat-containing protein [Myxococcus stipitatus]|uniref:Kelch repeat-containing protein n=1 Tax=Myxococcus stipitatus TaxID=83455 RepID=UPI0030CCA6C0